MFVYGGPGSQEVMNDWGLTSSFNYLWHQMLAQQGYIIVCVDNRGTGGRGRDFRAVTYADLGRYEVEDQLHAARYLQSLPYVDDARIGIWGWSYGGYMTSLCMTKGQGLFKTGIAVAPVTNWRFYDTIYTERYLKTPQLNPDGYDKNSPINYAANLKGNYFLVHGTADDNVHYQNSMEMVDALVKANKQFDTFFYPNKNHGIYGGYTRYHLFNKMTRYILANL
jgi:dipeptidyl-peptidase-4